MTTLSMQQEILSLSLHKVKVCCMFCIFSISDNKLVANAIVDISRRVFHSEYLIVLNKKLNKDHPQYCILASASPFHLYSLLFVPFLCNSSEKKMRANKIKHQITTCVFCNRIVYLKKKNKTKQMLPLAVKYVFIATQTPSQSVSQSQINQFKVLLISHCLKFWWN